jgi:prepilin-type N-terminal cleavage/methylation domain-containing protein
MRPTPSEPGAPERDRGYTLIEMLIAILLMGSIVLAIIGGMWAVVRASSQSDSRAKSQAILGAAADSITNMQHWTCPEINNPYSGFAAKAATTVGWPASSVSVSDYQYWNPAKLPKAGWDLDNSIQGLGCNPEAGLSLDKTLQKLTITVVSPDGKYTNSIDIVKADIRPEEIRDVTPTNP